MAFEYRVALDGGTREVLGSTYTRNSQADAMGLYVRMRKRLPANDAIRQSADAGELMDAWARLADRVDAAAGKLARRMVPKPDPEPGSGAR